MKLYGRHGKPKVQKILITCKYAGVDLKLHHIDWEFLKTQEFLHKNPNGRCPVLETAEGCMYESNAILRYFAKSNINKQPNMLYGANAWEGGLVEQWLDYFSGSIESSVAAIMFTIFGTRVYKQQEFNNAEENLKKYMGIIENHLKLRTFLVGNQLTIADICYVVHFGNLFQFYFDQNDLSQFPNVVRWFQLVRNQQPFLQVMGRQIYCSQKFKLNPVTEEAQLPASKTGASSDQPQKKEGGGEKKPQLTAEEIEERKKQTQLKKQQEKQQGGQQKQQPAKKEQQQPQKKKEEEVKESKVEKAPTVAPDQAEKDYLYNFKTFFVNEKDKSKAIQQFYKEHDAKKFSVWFLKYIKYTGDGEKIIPTNNLMGRFLDFLDTSRKELFGVHGVYGEEPNLEIRGCWLQIGTDINPGFKKHESFEYYNFVKCDFSSADHKKLFEEYWTGLEDDVSIVEGLRARTVKFFK